MSENKKDEIIKEMVKNGIAEIVIREGEAPENFYPKSVSISGTIESPRRFIVKRSGEFEPKKSHALVSVFDGTINLHIDETNGESGYNINGKIQKSKRYIDLGINNETGISNRALSQKLRMLRSIFADKDKHASIVTTLRNVKSKIDKEIEQSDDLRGNINEVFAQKVESNIPKSFHIEIPLIEGGEKVNIEVFILLAVGESRQILCTLESVDAAENIELQMEKLMEK